jgi:hypothetical protein
MGTEGETPLPKPAATARRALGSAGYLTLDKSCPADKAESGLGGVWTVNRVAGVISGAPAK